MVLANCEYSFEIGKGTRIEYDYGGLQRQIIDRLLFPKSFIQIENVLEVSVNVQEIFTLKQHFQNSG